MSDPNPFGNNLDEGDESPSLVLTGAAVHAKIDAPPSAEVARAVNTFFDPMAKRVKIVLEENDNIPPTGQFFGIQGRGYMLRPGEVAEVPLALVNVLNDAVMSTPVVDRTTQQVVGYRDKLRFPYRIVP